MILDTKKEQICAIDLFCGAGGLTKGLRNAGIDVRLGVDIDPACGYPYTENNTSDFLLKSVDELTLEEVQAYYKPASLRLLAGCAPCQTFSSYNKKATDADGRWWLLRQFSRLMIELQPDLVTMENVPGLEHQNVFKEFLQELSRNRYKVYKTVVNCADYGIPQQRNRLVLLASKLGEIHLLSASELNYETMTVRDAIGDMPELLAGSVDQKDPIHCCSSLSDVNMQRMKASIPGGSWRDWPLELIADCHKRTTGETYSSVYGRMEWDKPAPTITTQFYGFGNGRFGHPEQDRALSLREGAILQSFPPGYKFVPENTGVHSKTIGRLIGNAVPVRLGEVIGLSIKAHIFGSQNTTAEPLPYIQKKRDVMVIDNDKKLISEDSTYKLTVDLNVLEHLGINLYSNVAAVLTEAVANSWDADAENVYIKFDNDSKSKRIEIKDDGVGMSIDEMNQKYLCVGYRRREEDKETGTKTANGRIVMGRKGLGKLSLFSIANTIEIQSTKNGLTHGLRMTVGGIRESVRNGEPFYSPDPLPEDELTITDGTMIVLKDIKRQRLGRGVPALRKRLARRFSVIGETCGFRISINGEPISTADRGDLPVVQFLWNIGDEETDTTSAKELKETNSLSGRLDSWASDWIVKGWIGTARLPKQLDDINAGNLNSIVVFARGRLFHENILDKLNDGRLYTKYLTGQIEADFLDVDDEPDIATSDRQRVQEDDPRYIQLITFLRKRLTQVEKKWSEWRRIHEVKKAKENSPALTEWIDSMPVGIKKSAEKLIANLSALPIDEEEDRKTIYKHGILAFERMRLRESTEKLVSSIHNIDKIIELLADRDSFEASLYRDIVKTRLDAIRDFQNIVDENEKEKVLQKYLFDHLWLLDPAWERATESAIIESRLIKAGVIVEGMTKKERLGRVDIAYRTIAGNHVIVELKRANIKVGLIELQSQGQTYVDKLTKILQAQDVENPNIEVVFVIGIPLTEKSERVRHSMSAVSPGSRITHYDALISNAQNRYAEYLEKSKELDRIDGVIDRI